VPVRVSERALEVLKRALEAGRMDPATVGIRLTIGPAGDLRTAFAEEPDPGDQTIEAGGVRLFVSAQLATSDASVDVSPEHDTLVLGPPV
jgi:Fe-S cluster assembly iron-binding protein IscA